MSRFVIDGYGQIELNNCAFRRDGRIEAQCAPDSTDFATVPVENGMLLGVDRVARTVGFDSTATNPIALVYSSEHIYDERTPGLKNFKLNGTDDFYPRLGYLAVGDLFTTNCLSHSEASDAAFITALEAIATTPLYGGVSADGSIAVDDSQPTAGPILKVVEKTTMPNGTLGVKFQVLSC